MHTTLFLNFPHAFFLLGLVHDEGPDKDGGVGPYVQSERNASGLYLKYAKQLIEQGDAYYCFCDKERLESLKSNVAGEGSTEIVVYDKHCLGLSKEEVQANLDAGKPYVIRFNMPTEGTTTFAEFLVVLVCNQRAVYISRNLPSKTAY